jgi:Protein of unknown function (DUF3237)
MNQASSPPPAIEPLLVLSVQTTLVRTVTGTPFGDRTIFDVVSGTFEGPRLSGRVPEGVRYRFYRFK